MRLSDRDIHNHLLPAADDGFQNVQDSINAMERMAGAGCREFVFTPHLNPDIYPNVSEGSYREAYEVFREQIPSEFSVTTSLAAEYMIVSGFEKRISSRADELLTYSDGSILVEMSYYYRSPNLEQTLFELNMAGLRPILAHPERYVYMVENLSDFDRITEMGCRLQMNILSLTGIYGQQSGMILNYLLRRNMYSCMATDLHSLSQLDRIEAFRPGFFLRRKLNKAGFNTI